MIVYGDRSRRVRGADVGAALARAAASPPGLERHAALTTAFLDLAAIAQATADAAFHARGEDAPDAGADALMAALSALAATLLASWEGGPAPPLPTLPRLPDEVRAHIPEGHAFYALHPEAHALAARRLALAGPPRVVGIRSVGTGLAAMAAAALGAPTPVTLRPTGHPFAREVRAAPELLARLLQGAPDAHIVVADEGPGLSGSSFGSVADWLEAHGIPRARVAFLPSHAGDLGPQASAPHRARWATAQRPVVPPEELPGGRLEAWAADAFGPLDAPPMDLSGGGWRALTHGDEARWPAAMPCWERRKLLFSASGRRILLRFAGLGAVGEAKLARARALHAAGLSPEPLALLNGWLAEAWVEAERLPPGPPSPADLQRIAAHIGARARLFPDPGDGADLPTLHRMARHNAALALGEPRAAALDRWLPRLPALAAVNRPTVTDNRLLPHEWLRLPGGRLLKADALDHAEAHDLIGCQDPAWDVAGAAAEFDLDADAAETLRRTAQAAAGRRIDAGLAAFLRPCYLAYRMGQHRLAADALAGWPAEQARNEAAFARYAAATDAALRP